MTTTLDAPTSGPNPIEAPARVRAMLIDDHQLLAQSLALALELEGVECTLADLTDREQLIRDVAADPPALVLLDLDLGGAIGDGTSLVEPLVGLGARVLVVSATKDPDQVARALEQGATDVIDKHVPFRELLERVLATARGVATMAAADRHRLLREARERDALRARQLAPFARLSCREQDVLRALAQGNNVSVIATVNVVSEATVRTQVRAILTKLGVCSQLEAVAEANRGGWL